MNNQPEKSPPDYPMRHIGGDKCKCKYCRDSVKIPVEKIYEILLRIEV